MRLRRAVPKFPAKSSAPPRLPLRKNRSLRTRSESTLPQLLIPLHFKSFISNVYKKPGEGCPVPGPKFCNSSPPSYCHSERSEESAFSSFRLYYLTSLPRYITPSPAPVYTQECPQVQSPHGLLHNSRTPRGWGVLRSQQSLPHHFLTSLLSTLISLKQVRLLARNAVPHGLELEPARQRYANLRMRQLGGLMRNLARLSGGFRQQLRLARTVHRDEPPRRLVHGMPDGEQAVIAQNRSLFVAQRLGDAVAFVRLVDHSAVIAEHHMIFVKRARILRQRIEQPAREDHVLPFSECACAAAITSGRAL